MGLDKKMHFKLNNEIVTSYFRFFKRSLNILSISIWRPSWIFGIEKSTDIISDHLDELFVSSNISRDTPKKLSNCKSEELWYTPVFSKMALHGGGHLELKKMHKGDFWGLFGIRLGRCPGIIPEKISFLQFYSRFNPNALELILPTSRETCSPPDVGYYMALYTTLMLHSLFIYFCCGNAEIQKDKWQGQNDHGGHFVSSAT